MSPSPPPTVVWFKRDLRASDHEPLWEAAQRGTGRGALHLRARALVDECTHSAHYAFINGCLAELDQRLREPGGCLTIRRGEAVEVLESLRAETNFQLLVSYQETGKRRRDLRSGPASSAGLRIAARRASVPAAWCARGQTDRDIWVARWERRCAPCPSRPCSALPPTDRSAPYGVATPRRWAPRAAHAHGAATTG